MKRLLGIFSLLACATGVATAGPITVTETATGNGALDGTTFTASLITLTFQGDTSNVTFLSGIYSLIGTASVNVAGVGSDTFTDAITAEVGSTTGALGDNTVPSIILQTTSSSFSGYNLGSSFGPITGGGQHGLVSFATSGGTFDITAISVQGDSQDSTFTATVAAPEPASMLLLGAGMLGLAALRFRR
jgi:hypothetical protein